MILENKINKNNILISVVIPTHNRVDLLGRAIKSVQNQTYKNIEIIIVSDGSTDNTKDFVDEKKKKDNRISYFEYFPAKGANVARNLGIEKSHGDYIAFLDDDDEWLPTKLEKQLSVFLSDSSIGLVYTGNNNIYVNEKITYIYEPCKNGDLSSDILRRNYIGSTSSVILKREVLEESGLFDDKLPARQDYDLWIRICQITRIGVVKEKLLNYYNYTNKKQISSSVDKYFEAQMIIANKYKNLFDRLNEKQKKYISLKNIVFLAQMSLRNNNPKQCREYSLEALKYSLNIRAILLFVLSFFGFKATLKLRNLKSKFTNNE